MNRHPDSRAPGTCRNSFRNGPVALVLNEAKRQNAIVAFSLRTGGCSPVPFDSLNFSVTQGDDPANVTENLATFSYHLGVDPSRIATIRQVHGDRIHVWDGPVGTAPEADAIIVPRPGVFPGIKTADCLPVMVLDPVQRISAAVHAGWRGSVLRITAKVLAVLLTEFGSDPHHLIAALGPSIGTCCYEVDARVLEPLREAIPDSERFVTVVDGDGEKHGRPSFRLDLTALNRFELLEAGVPSDHIITTGYCTSCRGDLFFSHRRDGVDSGRHLSIAGFRE
jgi:polyphenol oxidase